MTVYLTKHEIIAIHTWTIQGFGGATGILHEHVIDSAVAAPRMTFDQVELYDTISAKAAALAYPLIHDHPFVDGNKRVGYVAAQIFLGRNGYSLSCDPDVAERTILGAAAGAITQAEFREWIELNLVAEAGSPPDVDSA